MAGLDDFNFLSDTDKDHIAYGMCVLGTAAVGATLGSIAGGQTLIGFAGGAVVGLFMCHAVEQPLRRALFSSNETMTDSDFVKLVAQTKRQYPSKSKREILDLIAACRVDAARSPQMYS
jgi:hypothetical protein